MNDKIKYLTTVFVLCAFNALLYYALIIPKEHSSDQPLKEFSGCISQWSSEEVQYNVGVISTLDPDITVYRVYRKNQGLPVTLFMAYYNSLEKAHLSHSPVVCYTGQGWDINYNTKVEIPIDSFGVNSIKVNQILQSKLDIVMITLFWYQSTEHVFSNRGCQKICLLMDQLLGKPDSNAFVRVSSSIPAGDDVEVLKLELYQFVRDVYPELRRFFTNEER